MRTLTNNEMVRVYGGSDPVTLPTIIVKPPPGYQGPSDVVEIRGPNSIQQFLDGLASQAAQIGCGIAVSKVGGSGGKAIIGKITGNLGCGELGPLIDQTLQHLQTGSVHVMYRNLDNYPAPASNGGAPAVSRL